MLGQWTGVRDPGARLCEPDRERRRRLLVAPPPPWLAATQGPVDVAAADSAEGAGDLLRAERLLVGAITQTYDTAVAPPMVARLERIYERLDWQRQLATLRSGRG